jgi:hypothetical protein
MESALYLKSITFLLIISFAVLLDNIVVFGNVRAIQESNNYYDCSSITNNNNKNNNVSPSTFTNRPVYSPFAIDLLDQKGRVLAHYPTDIIVSQAKVEEWKDIAYISEGVPYHPCTAKITINKDDKELVSQVVSPNVPEIISIKLSDSNDNPKLIFPRTDNITIEWEAQDLDKDKLRYLVLYSNDGGLTWPVTVADDIEKNSLTLNADFLPGNNANFSQFRIIATDGVNTDVRDSTPFSIPILNIGH